MTRRAILIVLVLLGVAAALLRPAGAGTARAHPLGNYSVNAGAEIVLYADAIHIAYAIDFAEIPTLQERDRFDRNGNGVLDAAEIDAAAAGLAANLALAAGGCSLPLTLAARSAGLSEGQAGLEVMRVDVLLVADAPTGGAEFAFADANYADRLGWREVVVRAAPGVALTASDAPAVSPSGGLRSYPDGLTVDSNVRTSRFTYLPGTGEHAPAVPTLSLEGTVAAAPAGGFASLIARGELTVGVIAIMLLAALGFGALHALEPGHGKSVVAAYFVGSRGSAAHAALFGLVVAATHSVGVAVIAVLTLYGSRYILPEDLYPWLTLGSGGLVVALGAGLLLARAGGRAGLRRLVRGHVHLRGLAHTHDHDHGGGHAHTHAPGRPAWRSLIALGLVDGLVPTPSTLVVLLAAMSLDRIALGFALIVAFSIGLALVLTTISVVAVAAQRLLARVRPVAGARGGGALARLVAALPVLAGFALVVMGGVIAARGAAATGLLT